MLHIGSIVWGVKDLDRSVKFWSAALDYKLLRTLEPNEAILIPKAGTGLQLILKNVSSASARRHHMDLHTTNQDDEVRRLLQCGAQTVIWNYEPDADYVVLADPDGNRFCVVQHA